MPSIASANLEPRPAVFDVLNIPPEDQIVETWQYKTDILESQDGTEQRIQTRNRPRVNLQFAYQTLNMKERAERVQHLYYALQRANLVPLFQYATPIRTTLTSIMEVNYTNAFLKWEDYIVIFNYSTRRFMYGRFNAYGEDQHKPGITTITILPDNFWDWENTKLNFTNADHIAFLNKSNNVVMPALTCTINDGLKFETGEQLTIFNFNCESLYSSDILAYDNPDPGILLFENIPVLDKTQLAPGDFALNYKRDILDNSTGIKFVDSNQDFPKVSGRVTFNIIDRADFHYWRKFIDRIKGGQKAFWLPSQVDDFEFSSMTDPMNFFIKRNNRYTASFLSTIRNNSNLLRIYIVQDIIRYRQISLVADDEANNRISIRIVGGLNQEPVTRIGMLYKVRADDTFTFTHYPNYSTISFAVHGTKD